MFSISRKKHIALRAMRGAIIIYNLSLVILQRTKIALLLCCAGGVSLLTGVRRCYIREQSAYVFAHTFCGNMEERMHTHTDTHKKNNAICKVPNYSPLQEIPYYMRASHRITSCALGCASPQMTHDK